MGGGGSVTAVGAADWTVLWGRVDELTECVMCVCDVCVCVGVCMLGQ